MLELLRYLPLLVLLFMNYFLNVKNINWLKLKETGKYLIKSIIMIFIVVVLDSILGSIKLSDTFLHFVCIVLTIAFGLIWYYEFKKVKSQ